MMNQPQKRDESQILSVLTIFCYALALAAAGAFGYSLLDFAMRVATQQTGILYSMPR